MNSLRSYFKTEIGERSCRLAHLDNGQGKPLCGYKVRTGGETNYPQWKEFSVPATCIYCLNKVEKK